MRKSLLVLALALLLAGCSAAPAGEVLTPPTLAPGETEAPSPAAEDAAVMTCRLVGDGLLAEGEDGPYGGTSIFTFGTDGDTVVMVDGQPARVDHLQPGMLLTVTWNGMVAESYPGQLGTVYALSADSGDTDDRCGLYLQVLEDLWEVDPGLNTGLEELGVDFSGLTDLTESEKSALAWVFGNAHGLMPITGTLEELWQAGYLTPMTEPAEGQEDSVALYRWENGCLFSLSGSAEEGFTAQKWASGLGAYVFSDCTAAQDADGTWSYTVGAEAIA